MADKYLTHGPDTVNQLLSSTLSQWAQETYADQVFKKKPFLTKMLSRAKRYDGGASVILPVMYAKNSTAAFYSDYDILDTTPQDGLTSAQYHWKQGSASISISGKLEAQNSGSKAVIGLLDVKKNQAVESLEDIISAALFASSTGANDISSLVNLIDATSTIGEINSTTNSWWQATSTASGSFSSRGLSDMRTLWTTIDVNKPASNVDMVVTTAAVYNFYEASLTPLVRYEQSQTPTGSFPTLKFKTADVFYDNDCTSGVLYMFSSDDVYLALNTKNDFRTTEFVKPSNQDARTAQVIFMGQLVSRARRKTGKLTGISA
jgi:hypothetical protein